MKIKNRLPVIQAGVQEGMTPIPRAPKKALNRGVDPAPEERGIKEARLVRGKALEKDGKSQVQATSRIVRKISMALISKKGLGVKKLVMVIQVIVEKDHTQQISQAVVDNKDMRVTQRISLPVLTSRSLAQMSL